MNEKVKISSFTNSTCNSEELIDQQFLKEKIGKLNKKFLKTNLFSFIS